MKRKGMIFVLHSQLQKIQAVPLSVSHRNVLIVFVLSGNCLVKRFSHIKEFYEGDVFFINRNEVYAVQSENGCVLQWVELDDSMDPLLPLVDSIGSEDQEKEMAEIYRDCVFLKNLLQFGLSQSESLVLQEILEALRSDYQKVNQSVSDSTMMKLSEIMRYIEIHANEKISLQDISNQFSMKKTNFATLFKQITGKTLMESVSEFRLKKAEELLLFSSMSQQDILKECGFSDSKYFYRYFMEEFGMTPSVWKEKMQAFNIEKKEALSTEEADPYLKKMMNELSGLKTETKLYQQSCLIRTLIQNELFSKEDVIEVNLLHPENYIEAAGERINAWYGFDLMMNELRHHQNTVELKIRLTPSVKQEELEELFVLLKKSSLRISSKRMKTWRFVIESETLQHFDLAKQIQKRIQKEFMNSETMIRVV